MKDLILGILVLACLVFAFGVEWLAYTNKSHAQSTDILAGVALFSAVGLAVPMQFASFVNTARRVIPWADRRTGGRSSSTTVIAPPADDLPDVKP